MGCVGISTFAQFCPIRSLNIITYIYSATQKKRYEYCFMKQKCQIQIGIPYYNKTEKTV